MIACEQKAILPDNWIIMDYFISEFTLSFGTQAPGRYTQQTHQIIYNRLSKLPVGLLQTIPRPHPSGRLRVCPPCLHTCTSMLDGFLVCGVGEGVFGVSGKMGFTVNWVSLHMVVSGNSCLISFLQQNVDIKFGYLSPNKQRNLLTICTIISIPNRTLVINLIIWYFEKKAITLSIYL